MSTPAKRRGLGEWQSVGLLPLYYCVRLISFQAILCAAFPQTTGYGSGCAIPSHLMATFIMVKAKGVIVAFPRQRWNEEALEAQGEQRFSACKRLPTCTRTPLVAWWKRSTTLMPRIRSLLYAPSYADPSPVSNHAPALDRTMVRVAGAWRQADGAVP